MERPGRLALTAITLLVAVPTLVVGAVEAGTAAGSESTERQRAAPAPELGSAQRVHVGSPRSRGGSPLVEMTGRTSATTLWSVHLTRIDTADIETTRRPAPPANLQTLVDLGDEGFLDEPPAVLESDRDGT